MQPKNFFFIATLMQMVIGAPITLSEGVGVLEEPRDAAAIQTDGNPHGLLKRTLGKLDINLYSLFNKPSHSGMLRHVPIL